MSQVVTILDNGDIEGYLTIPEFAKKHGVTAHAIRKEIEREYLDSIVVGSGRDRKHYLREDTVYIKPKLGRPRKRKEVN